MQGSLQIEGIVGSVEFESFTDNKIKVLRGGPADAYVEHLLLDEVRRFSIGGISKDYAYKSFCDDYFLFDMISQDQAEESI